MNVTPLQAAMLRKIARDKMNQANGGEPECADDTHTWADGIIEDAQDKGVFTSLLNAGLVGHSGKGRDAGVWFTDAGLTAYKALTA